MRRFPLLVALLAGLVSPVQADQLADADVAGWLARMSFSAANTPPQP